MVAMNELAIIRALTTGTAMCSRQERFGGARRVGKMTPRRFSEASLKGG